MSIEKYPEKYFEFLVDLRDSGVTNMWGAAPYLKEAFPELSREKSTKIFLAWIESFNE
jgi:hypothetical protein